MNVEELMEVLEMKDADLSPSESEFKMQGNTVSDESYLYSISTWQAQTDTDTPH